MVFQNLKDVPDASRIVNVNVSNALVAFHEESQLQVSKVVSGLEAARLGESDELSRQVVQGPGNLVKQPHVGAILHFLPQLFFDKREEAAPT
jgi:uncharacterized protein (AIM24 family)